MSQSEQPLFFEPILVERVWGGRRLAAMFGKTGAPGKIIGESWELADRPEARTKVRGGPWAGRTLTELLRSNPREILGELAAEKPERFPLLIKFVDAGAQLSVQVHPDDALGRAMGDRGKSECWVVLHAEPGARVIRGLRPGVTRADYEAAVAQDRVEDILHSFTPRAGDVVAIPPGLIHASGAGVLVAEVQQNSDLTLRIYDYKRLGLDGRPRQLHLKEALGAIRFAELGPEFHGDMRADTVPPTVIKADKEVRIEALLDGLYFDLQRRILAPRAAPAGGLPACPRAPRVLMALAGSGTLAGAALQAGDTVLLPAAAPDLALAAGAQGLTILLSQAKSA